MIKQHYEKVITVCAFFFVFVNVGLASTAFAVHQPYIVAIEGIGDTGGSLILSVRTLVSFLAMLVLDRYYQLLDVRVGVLVASLCTTAGFIVYSMAGSLPMFFCGAVFLGFGYGLGGLAAMTYLANRWFVSGIGGAIGFASMGSGLASMIMPLIVARVIESFSLSTAFLVEAVVAFVVGLLVFAILRNRPSDMGLQPYAGNEKARKRPVRQVLPASSGNRFLLMAAVMCVGIFSCCGITYLSVLATSSGFDTMFAATLVSIAGFALTVAKFLSGELFDHLGVPRGSAIMFTLGIVGFGLCCLAGLGNAASMVVAAILVGSGLSLGSVGVSVWSLELAEPEARTRQVKNFQVAYSLGGFIANTLPGIVKDLVGTYVVSYAAVAVIIAFAFFVILRFYRKYTVLN